MPVYWSLLFMTLIIALFSYSSGKIKVEQEGQILYKTKLGFAILSCVFIIFFVGLRDSVLDTYWYVGSFEAIPTDWSGIIAYSSKQSSGVLFYLLQGVFKKFISDNHYIWFIFLAMICCFCIFRVIYKYSIDFPLSMYLFIANASFTWLLNGARQFLAVCILFTFTDWLIKGKKLRYIIVVLAMSLIHISAIFIIPIALFVTSKKILGKRMYIFAIITVVGTYFAEPVIAVISNSIGADYNVALESGAGSGVMRLIVSSVPLIIVLFAHRLVKKNATPSIVISINMSFIGVCFYFASMFTNGILVGRMPIYFTLYNLYLMPWLIKKCFTKESSRIIWWLCIGFYLVYFYYQMNIAWGGLEYTSEILKLYF